MGNSRAHHSCRNSQARRDRHRLSNPNRGETNPQQNLSEPERNSDFRRPTAPHGHGTPITALLEPWGCSCNTGQTSPHCPRGWGTAGPQHTQLTPELGPAWITVQGEQEGSILQPCRELRAFLPHAAVPSAQSPAGCHQSPPCCPALAEPERAPWPCGALQPRPVSTYPGSLQPPTAVTVWEDSWGLVGALRS